MRSNAARETGPAARLLFVVPAVAGIVALGAVAAGHAYAAAGIAVGATLGVINTALLAKRVLAVIQSPEPGMAMIAMQAGLLVVLTVAGGLTVLMTIISRQMAVAMAISFFFSQTLQLAAYFFAGRSRTSGSSLTVADGRQA